jgi:hypothetical protein
MTDKVPSKKEIQEIFEESEQEKPNKETITQSQKANPESLQQEESTEKEITYEEGDIGSASEIAKQKLAKAMNKTADSTISISKEDDIWNAVVEIVDEEYLPGMKVKSMSDIIGVYEVKLSNDGNLLSWTKKSSHKRGQI